MKYWDSSALVPLLVEEETTEPMQALLAADKALITWWGSEVECTSALARLERESALETRAVSAALARLQGLARGWHEIAPSSAVRAAACRLLRVHPLRSADALQLAAAVVACEGRPETLEVVCLDERLGQAAQKEGFPLLDRAALLAP